MRTPMRIMLVSYANCVGAISINMRLDCGHREVSCSIKRTFD